MVIPLAEPDSPRLDYDDDVEPELDGVRHLSVSSNGTIDSILSQDENPTPPQSPGLGPVVHVTSPEAHYSSPWGERDHSERFRPSTKEDESMLPALSFLRSPFVYDTGPPTPGGVKVDIDLSLPPEPTPMPPTPVPGAISRPSLAERRALSGSLTSNMLANLQQMRFEASGDAGMGLGVEPGTPGSVIMEDVSPTDTGVAVGTHSNNDLLRLGNALPSLSPIRNRRMGAGPQRGLRRPPSGLVLKIPHGFGSPGSSPLSSPMTAAPPSPHVARTSAFILGTTGPRTPLTPSHVPPAPALGSSGAAFEWHPYSFPDSPSCPTPPSSNVPTAERTCYFGEVIPPSPSSDRTVHLPTPGSDKARTPSGRSRTPIPASPLGNSRFTSSISSESASSTSNPFFH